MDNVAPYNLVILGPDSSPEGTSITYTATYTDPGTLDTHTYHWSAVANNGQVISDGYGTTYTFTPVDNLTNSVPATYTVSLTVTDKDGGAVSGSKSTSVTDVAPTISLSGATDVDEGSMYTLTLGAITDPGTDTVTQWVVFWGDNTVDTYTSGGAKTHIYDDNALVTDVIRVTLVDEDGARQCGHFKPHGPQRAAHRDTAQRRPGQ